jgi:nucleotide-binding universal stress UspA family protein
VVTAPSQSQYRVDHLWRAPITVGVDEGGRSTSAVLWAAGEAERSGRSLCLVAAHAGSRKFGRGREQAEQDLATLSRRLFLSNLECRVEAGAPLEVLLDAAGRSSLLVVGRRGWAAARRLMVGSTSLGVASGSPVPVVVVPDRWVQPTMVSKPLVVGIGLDRSTGAGTIGLPADEAVLRFGFERAHKLRVPLLVVAAQTTPAPSAWANVGTDEQSRYRAVLESRLSPWRTLFPDVEVVAHTGWNAPRETILEAAGVAQLAIVGRTGGRRHPLHLGSTAEGVLLNAERPVAVIPMRHQAAARGRGGYG